MEEEKLTEAEYNRKYGVKCRECGGTGKKSTITFRRIVTPIYAILVIAACLSFVFDIVSK